MNAKSQSQSQLQFNTTRDSRKMLTTTNQNHLKFFADSNRAAQVDPKLAQSQPKFSKR
jgi:hypothetical protein